MRDDDFPAIEDDARRKREIEEILFGGRRDDYFRDDAMQQDYYDILSREEDRRQTAGQRRQEEPNLNRSLPSAAVAPPETPITGPVPLPRARPEPPSQAQLFEKRFRGTALERSYDAIKAAAEKYGISPGLAASIMAQETGNGKNVKNNNPGGLMRRANPGDKQQFKTIDDGIDESVKTMARVLKEAGGDMERFQEIYAPIGAKNDSKQRNQYWLDNVRWLMRHFGEP